jgi:hypothetical protein
MRYQSGRLTSLTLGALSLALASCGEQPAQPDLTADQPVAASAPAPDTWIVRADMPVERTGVVTADVPNAAGQSILYVIGGSHPYPPCPSLARVDAYNVATDSWSRKRDLPIALDNITGAGVIGGKIYIAGGTKTSCYGWDVYAAFVYDPARDTWTRLPGMPARGAYGIVGVIGDKLYVSVPYVDRSDRSRFFRYDPATGKWATLPSPAHAYFMGGVLYGKLYLVGNQTQMYDPATNQWTAKAPPPSVYINIWGSAAAAQGKLYVFNGTLRYTLVYAPLSDSWTLRAQGPTGLGPTSARVFLGGRPRIELVGYTQNYQYVP